MTKNPAIDLQVKGILLSSVISFHGCPNDHRAESAHFCCAAAFHGQPELLVSDVMMQGLSGIELAVQIQQVCPDCQILLISGAVGTAHPMVEEMGDHPFQLLAKPLEPILRSTRFAASSPDVPLPPDKPETRRALPRKNALFPERWCKFRHIGLW